MDLPKSDDGATSNGAALMRIGQFQQPGFLRVIPVATRPEHLLLKLAQSGFRNQNHDLQSRAADDGASAAAVSLSHRPGVGCKRLKGNVVIRRLSLTVVRFLDSTTGRRRSVPLTRGGLIGVGWPSGALAHEQAANLRNPRLSGSACKTLGVAVG